ncbi:MAG: hypothetical protein IJ590_04615 [Rickettsiales bacterium]|nr:hypothetical protein [Rickettsiales bacterium]
MEDSSIKTHKNNDETLPDQWETLVLNLPKPVFLFSSKIIAEDIRNILANMTTYASRMKIRSNQDVSSFDDKELLTKDLSQLFVRFKDDIRDNEVKQMNGQLAILHSQVNNLRQAITLGDEYEMLKAHNALRKTCQTLSSEYEMKKSCVLPWPFAYLETHCSEEDKEYGNQLLKMTNEYYNKTKKFNEIKTNEKQQKLTYKNVDKYV